MIDHTQLLERLRNAPPNVLKDRDAAAAIEAAQAEIATLKVSLREARDLRNLAVQDATHHASECVAARGQRDAALGALKNIARGVQMDYPHRFTSERVAAIAKEAISAGAPQSQPTASDKTWCGYVAGIIGTFIGERAESETIKGIAAIIERRLWALPVPKAQEPAPETWIVVKEHVWEHGDGERPTLAYLLPAEFGRTTHPTFGAASTFIGANKLPVGWVAMQLRPGVAAINTKGAS